MDTDTEADEYSQAIGEILVHVDPHSFPSRTNHLYKQTGDRKKAILSQSRR
jgi:hypothetical protein